VKKAEFSVSWFPAGARRPPRNPCSLKLLSGSGFGDIIPRNGDEGLLFDSLREVETLRNIRFCRVEKVLVSEEEHYSGNKEEADCPEDASGWDSYVRALNELKSLEEQHGFEVISISRDPDDSAY